jgi:hypothetical protein
MEIDVGGKIPVTLPEDIYGILGIRSWNVKDSSRHLQSLFAGHEWTRAVQQAKRPTTLPGEHGFYAYKLTSRLDISEFQSTLTRRALFPDARIQIHGLVELRGRVIEHTDGVIRGEWCRILCFFLPAPSVYSGVDMKGQIREAGWLKSILGRYNVPVYLTDASRFAAIFERLLEFDRGRADAPVPVEYQEMRPSIVKRVDELVEQANQSGFQIPHILLNRKQMKEFKEAISADAQPLEKPVVYKRIAISCIDYAEDRTPYLTVNYRLAG